MDTLHTGIIALLRSALNNEKLDLPESFDFEAALDFINIHQLTGLALQGATLCGIPRNHPAMIQMTRTFCRILQQSRKQTKKLQEVFERLDHHEIDYLPFKGSILKFLYPRPDYRLMGDADILIHPEQYPKIRPILSALGMKPTKETDYELVWQHPDLTLELHKRLIATHNKDYHAYYGDTWPAFCKKGAGASYLLQEEDHFIYLLVHFAKHYREGSISAKNICDFYICKKAWRGMDESYISAQLKKLNLLTFYRNIQDLLDAWFEGKAFTKEAEAITLVAFQGGIYDYEKSEMVSSLIKLEKEPSSFKKGGRGWLFRRFFPPIEIMECSYPIVKKLPLLLPLFWGIRLIKMIFCDPKRVLLGLSRTKAVNKLGSDALSYYEDQLHAVGLDFNFDQ